MKRTARAVRPARLLLLAAAALLAALLLTVWLDMRLPQRDAFAVQASRGLVVQLESAQAPRMASRLLAAGLAEHGIGLASLALPSAITRPSSAAAASSALAGLGREISRLQTETGLAANRLVIAAHSDAIPPLLRLLSAENQSPDPAGLILLTPGEDDGLDPASLARLPDGLSASVIAPAGSASARRAGDLFLWLTGEDASLFPGFGGDGRLAAQTWLSVDGRSRLILLPALSPVESGWSPRLAQAVVQSAAETLADNPAAQTETAARLAASAAIVYSRTLLMLLALLLGAAAPLLAIIGRPSPATGPDALPGSAPEADPLHWTAICRLPPVLEILLYLPAAILAVPAGSLLARLAADGRLTAEFRFYALLGIYGWLYLAASAIQRHVPSRHETESSAAVGECCYLVPVSRGKPVLATLLAALAGAAYLGLAAYWLQTVNGRVILLPGLGAGLRILPLAVLLLPALAPFSRPVPPPERKWPLAVALLHGILPTAFLVGLRLAEQPGDWPGALMAAAAGLALLLTARALARALVAPTVRALVPALSGYFLLLLFRATLPV